MLKTVAFVIASVAVTAYAQQGPSSGTGSPPTSVPGNPASLQVKGTVMVNQRALTDDTSTLFAGDRIETSAGAAARISAPGLSIYVPENSCLQYNGEQVEMCNCGSLSVNSHRPLSVAFREREITVSTVEPNTAFAMSAVGKDFEVADQQGAIAITRKGAVLSSMASGTSRSFADLGCAAPTHDASEIGTAAALAAPAIIAATVLARSEKRAPISSLNP